MVFLNIHGRTLHVVWKSIMPLCLNIYTHSHNNFIINDNSNYLLVYIWSIHRLHVTIQMIPYSLNVIQLNRLLVRVTKWVFQWMVCHYSMYHLFRVTQMICNTYWMKEDCPISPPSYYCFQTLLSYWIGCGWNWCMHLITHIFNCQLEFEFTIQVNDITIHILEHKHQSIKSVNHRYADVLHGSTIVGRGIINDHCGEQIIVLIGNLHIGGSYQWWIHMDHLAISSDVNHIPSIEWSR